MSGYGQIDNVGSGRAIQFDGVDDFVLIGDHYHDLNFPFTISAWVYFDPDYNFPIPIFTTNHNDLDYHGFWFFISSTAIWCEIGDGKGGNNPAFRKGKFSFLTFPKGVWVHVSAVMKSISDIDLYINGKNVGGEPSGFSSGPMQMSKSGDLAKIGYFISNTVTYRFKGSVDEVRLWNKALSEIEVRSAMCRKLSGSEPGLIGYWNFDETSGNTIFDKSPNQFHGTLMGNPIRMFSGAPIGDVSTYLYPASWSGNSISFLDGQHSGKVSNVTGSPPGVHIYEVEELPSQITGLDPSKSYQHYYGVFIATINGGNSFDLEYKVNELVLCSTKGRKDNSVASWIDQNPLSIQDRIEFIGIIPAPGFTLDLGPDKNLCDQVSLQISTGVDPIGKTFKWNTGASTPSITITNSGNYSVEVSDGCNTITDEVTVSLLPSPPQNFSLGEDEVLCTIIPKRLQPFENAEGFVLTWQDNSHDFFYEVTSAGKYAVRIENYCGVVSDTIEFSLYDNDARDIPNVITPNDDPKNQYFMVETGFLGSYLAIYNRWGKEVYRNDNYQNNWDGKELDTGVYYYLMRDRCLKEFKGHVSIIR